MVTLDKIPGQRLASRSLINSFNMDRMASAYLFYGAEGRGKWTAAIGLAALVNCEKPLRNEAGRIIDSCGECRNCRQIGKLIFPDLYFALPLTPYKKEEEFRTLHSEYIERKREEPYRIITSARQQTISVESAYDIRRKISMKPSSGVKRVVLFYQMEKMLTASADALLKMIEEPPPETIIIMTAVDPGALLPTIRSRAQQVRFLPLSEEEIVQYLSDKYQIGREKASFAAHLAEGSLGQALSFVEEEEDSSHRQMAFLLFKNILIRDAPSIVAAISELVNPNDRGESEQIIRHWQSFLSDIIRIKHGEKLTALVNLDLSKELEALTPRINSSREFGDILEDLKKTNIALRRNIHIRVGMAALALKLRDDSNQTP